MGVDSIVVENPYLIVGVSLFISLLLQMKQAKSWV